MWPLQSAVERFLRYHHITILTNWPEDSAQTWKLPPFFFRTLWFFEAKTFQQIIPTPKKEIKIDKSDTIMLYDHTIKIDSKNQFSNILLEANNLKTQKLSQREDKTPVCNKCDKVFSKASNLKTHMCSHTGEKPFGCKKCDKTFSTSSALKPHKLSHTGEKPCYCNKCDKAFS